jgi:hypothetical protein
MLARKRNVIAVLAALMVLAAVPGWAMADAIYLLRLRPTMYEPCASGQVEWGYETRLRPPHIHTLFHVAVQDVLSTDLVEVRINGVPLDQLISLTDGHGELSLDSDWGDDPPWLDPGHLVEIYDAYDRTTLLLWGVVDE